MIIVAGTGLVGTHAAEQLRRRGHDVRSVSHKTVNEVDPASADVVLLAHGGDHARHARRFLTAGCHVVSVSDDTKDVLALLDLNGDDRVDLVQTADPLAAKPQPFGSSTAPYWKVWFAKAATSGDGGVGDGADAHILGAVGLEVHVVGFEQREHMRDLGRVQRIEALAVPDEAAIAVVACDPVLDEVALVLAVALQDQMHRRDH